MDENADTAICATTDTSLRELRSLMVLTRNNLRDALGDINAMLPLVDALANELALRNAPARSERPGAAFDECDPRN